MSGFPTTKVHLLRQPEPGRTGTLCAFNKRWRSPVLTNDVAMVTCHMCLLKLREMEMQAIAKAIREAVRANVEP